MEVFGNTFLGMHLGIPLIYSVLIILVAFVGILGSYLVEKIVSFSLFVVLTLCNATFLGICLAFSMDLSIRLSGYSLANRSTLSSDSLRSLDSGLVQILTILRLNEYGIA